MPAGVSELSLRQLPIELDDLEQVKSLPQLRTLHLSGAQKLPPDAVSALLAPQYRRGAPYYPCLQDSETMKMNIALSGQELSAMS